MSQASQTYLLTLTRKQFEALTYAIMLESNKVAKLQGFGQCLAHWLERWQGGELVLQALPEQGDRRSPKSPKHAQIYVALNPESTQVLKALREELSQSKGQTATVADAINRLIDSIVTDQLTKSACTSP